MEDGERGVAAEHVGERNTSLAAYVIPTEIDLNNTAVGLQSLSKPRLGMVDGDAMPW